MSASSTPAALRDAIETIQGAVTNLRLYRERLTDEDYAATLGDIEDAVDQIDRAMRPVETPSPAKTRSGKRRAR